MYSPLTKSIVEEIYSETSIQELIEEIDYTTKNMYPKFLMYNLYARITQATDDFQYMMDALLTANPDIDPNTYLFSTFNPKTYWILFTFAANEEPTTLSHEQRNNLTLHELECEITREILGKYITSFERLSTLTVPSREQDRFDNILRDYVNPCIYLYYKWCLRYTTYLQNLHSLPLIRHRSIETVAHKRASNMSTNHIENTMTLASNPLRRAFEYVL
jgi:hypothetical protein